MDMLIFVGIGAAAAIGVYLTRKYIKLFRKGKDPGWEFLGDGEKLQNENRHSEAMKKYKEAERHFRKENNTPDAAKAVFMEALLYKKCKKYEAAMDRFTYAAEMCRNLNDDESLGHAYMKMAETCEAQKKFAGAGDYYERTLRIWKKLRKEKHYAYACFHLARIDAKLGNNKQAAVGLNEAVREYSKLVNLDELAGILTETGDIEAKIGASASAMAHYKEAEKHLRRLKKNEMTVIIQKKIVTLEKNRLSGES
jgi:tetratricopeptide (TPR) repeat protein